MTVGSPKTLRERAEDEGLIVPQGSNTRSCSLDLNQSNGIRIPQTRAAMRRLLTLAHEAHAEDPTSPYDEAGAILELATYRDDLQKPYYLWRRAYHMSGEDGGMATEDVVSVIEWLLEEGGA